MNPRLTLSDVDNDKDLGDDDEHIQHDYHFQRMSN